MLANPLCTTQCQSTVSYCTLGAQIHDDLRYRGEISTCCYCLSLQLHTFCSNVRIWLVGNWGEGIIDRRNGSIVLGCYQYTCKYYLCLLDLISLLMSSGRNLLDAFGSLWQRRYRILCTNILWNVQIEVEAVARTKRARVDRMESTEQCECSVQRNN